MTVPRDILKFNVPFHKLPTFMDDNRLTIISESVDACERIIFEDLEEVILCEINVEFPFGTTKLKPKIVKEDISDPLEMMLDWSVDMEQYELSHRIKIMLDFLKENEL